LPQNGFLGTIVVAAEVFKTAFIPQKLADIDHYEREIIKMSSKGDNTGCAKSFKTFQFFPRLAARSLDTHLCMLGCLGSPRRTALDSAYDDLLDPGGGNAEDDDFMYQKIVGLDPAKKASRLEPDLLAQQEPRKVVVEFKEPGKLGVSFDREDADLKVVEVAEVGLAAQEGSIRPGMQLHAVESPALGGLVNLEGLGYTQALGSVAKAGRPMTLTFLCYDDDESDENSDGSGSGDDEEDQWIEKELLHDGTGRPTEDVKAGKKANKKAVKAVRTLRLTVAVLDSQD
jgi:hypothetical protein